MVVMTGQVVVTGQCYNSAPDVLQLEVVVPNPPTRGPQAVFTLAMALFCII